MDGDYSNDSKSGPLADAVIVSTGNDPVKRTRRLLQGEKLRSADKVERIPVKVIPTETYLRKPPWLKIR